MHVQFSCKVSADLQDLLDSPLPFSPGGVLLYSTHATESYQKAEEPYQESAPYRTTDPQYNMIGMGTELKALLEEQNIPVLQDTKLHDSPNYNTAYAHSRKSAADLLRENPGYPLVLDLHRDAVETASGQLRPLAPGTDCAQILIIVGTDQSGLAHDNWQRNLSVGLKLQWYLEQLQPGITRPLTVRSQRFNQDLSDGALLIEIGAAGNTRQEARASLAILAQAIALLLSQ